MRQLLTGRKKAEMEKRQQIHLTFKMEDPDHVKAWEKLNRNKGSEKYPSAADYVAAAINGFGKGTEDPDKKTENLPDKAQIAFARYLVDEIEKRMRPIIRGPVGK